MTQHELPFYEDQLQPLLQDPLVLHNGKKLALFQNADSGDVVARIDDSFDFIYQDADLISLGGNDPENKWRSGLNRIVEDIASRDPADTIPIRPLAEHLVRPAQT